MKFATYRFERFIEEYNNLAFISDRDNLTRTFLNNEAPHILEEMWKAVKEEASVPLD